MLNKVMVIGRLTKDVELRYTQKPTAVGQASVAITRKWTTEAGERKEEVTFIDFTIWGKSAETLAQYTCKGKMVYLEGRWTVEEWEDKQTHAKRKGAKLTVESFQILEWRDKPEAVQQPAAATEARPSQTAAQVHGDDKLPF